MFEDLGTVMREPDGDVRVRLNEGSVTFYKPALSDISSSERIMQVRRMLESHDIHALLFPQKAVLIVMCRASTTVYQLNLGIDSYEKPIPGDNLGYHQHVHSKHDYSDHIEKPNNHTHYEAISARLAGAQKILIFGSGTGSHNAMDLYLSWLLENHPKLSESIGGTMSIDESQMTEEQMLRKAHMFFKQVP